MEFNRKLNLNSRFIVWPIKLDPFEVFQVLLKLESSRQPDEGSKTKMKKKEEENNNGETEEKLLQRNWQETEIP